MGNHRRGKNGRYDPREKREAKDQKAEIMAMEGSTSLGAALQRFVNKHELTTGEPASIAATAEYLRPFLQRLDKVERGLPEFPPNSSLPWSEMESIVLDVEDNRSMRQIAQAYGLDPTHVYEMSRERKWKARRAILRELHARASTVRALAGHTALLAGHGGDPKLTELQQEEQLCGLVESCIVVFREALKDGQVQFRSARDLDVLARLMAFLKGRADHITETRNRISPEELEAIAAKVAKRTKFSAADVGIVTDAQFTVLGDDEPLLEEVG